MDGWMMLDLADASSIHKEQNIYNPKMRHYKSIEHYSIRTTIVVFSWEHSSTY